MAALSSLTVRAGEIVTPFPAPALSMPFDGLATPWRVILTIALVTIIAMFLWTFVLFVRGQHARRNAPDPDQELADAMTWIFLVPALNEEVTIADSIDRLRQVNVADKRIVVIDDGSDDRTPEILAEFDDSTLVVVRRDPPAAREGKAAALNYAYRELPARLGAIDRANTIVCVVDADGRLLADAPSFMAGHFRNPEVGGVQSQVRIYNRQNLLGWFQDVEFGVYGALFQAGRNDWGTAGMGGNGQFNRLTALDDVADETGPWRDKLTEDQDLGLRLIAAGWLGKQDLRATVEQQGLSRLRPLLRQRTRWSQGNLQCQGLLGAVLRSPRPMIARVESAAYIMMPFWQSIIGVSILVAVYLLITDQAAFWEGGNIWQLAFFYLLGFGGILMGCVAARAARGWKHALLGLLIAQVYAFYTWLIWPVLLRSTFRQLTDRRTWAKTDRESLEKN